MSMLTSQAECHSLLYEPGTRFGPFANFQGSIGTSTIHWALWNQSVRDQKRGADRRQYALPRTEVRRSNLD
jgi:hypothetical protein